MTDSNYLRGELRPVVEELDLPERDKLYLHSRWLDQLVWMDGRATRNRTLYFAARTTVVIGGILVPAFVSLLGFCDSRSQLLSFHNFTIGLSLLVALSASVEGLFHWGEKWQHYRGNVEVLRSEGWEFAQLSGDYSRFANVKDALPLFVEHVEGVIRSDVSSYFEKISLRDRFDDSNPLQP